MTLMFVRCDFCSKIKRNKDLIGVACSFRHFFCPSCGKTEDIVHGKFTYDFLSKRRNGQTLHTCKLCSKPLSISDCVGLFKEYIGSEKK